MATASKSQERLKEASQGLVGALSNRALGAAEDKVGNLTSKMESMAQEGGLSMPKLAKPVVKSAVGSGASAVKDKVGDAASGLGEKVKDAVTGGSKKSGSNIKVTTILETIDVGVPIELAYNQWTEFGSFPSFMKKVEVVDAVEDQKLKWKAQIFWSHREWESTILDQRPEERIIWRSKGKKGSVDGAVTFHELAPELTRIIVVLEYHPQGLFERTANLWRAQGRRVRAELLHFRRHVMSHALLDPDSVNGWRGVIEDGEVVQSDEERREEEERDQESGDDRSADEPTDEEGDEQDDEQGDEDDEPTDEEGDEQGDEDEADDGPQDEADEPDDEPRDETEETDEADEPDEAGDEPEPDEYADDDETAEVDEEYSDEEENR